MVCEYSKPHENLPPISGNILGKRKAEEKQEPRKRQKVRPCWKSGILF
jgi:hypothetical protein